MPLLSCGWLFWKWNFLIVSRRLRGQRAVSMRKWFFVLVLVPGAAFAGPREDVYAASQRCAGLGDNRAWLDCYYGAAQPMRQQLQLPPAPQAQLALVPGLSPHSPITAAPALPQLDHRE